MMNSVLYVLLTFVLGVSSAKSGEGDSLKNPRWDGQPFTGGKQVELNEALNDPEAYASSPILLKGVISSVCQNKGCWMYLTDGNQRIRVTFKDYGFFVPTNSNGKKAVVHGVTQEKVVSEAVLRHWAEEEIGGNPESIEGEQHVVMFNASGLVIENGTDLSEEQKETIGVK
jgi:hypothetical protein